MTSSPPRAAVPSGDSHKMKLRFGDILIIVLVLALSLGAYLLLPKSGSTVLITESGREVYRGSLSADATITLTHNTIEIKDGHVTMTEADCDDGLCLRMGEATPERPIVCLPNGVTVEISGESEVDAVTW